MKPLLKSVITFVAGAALGSGGCFIFCKKFYEQREIKDLEEAEKDWTERQARKWKSESDEAYRDISTPETSEKEEDSSKDDENTRDVPQKADFKPVNSFENDYTKYYKSEARIPLKTPENATTEHPKDSDEDDNMADPSIITDEEYGDLSSGWDEKAATYYIDIGELIDDETDEPVDILNTVSQECLDEGEKQIKGQKSNYIFVKCPRISTAYTVTYQDKFEYDDEDTGEDEW